MELSGTSASPCRMVHEWIIALAGSCLTPSRFFKIHVYVPVFISETPPSTPVLRLHLEPGEAQDKAHTLSQKLVFCDNQHDNVFN